MPAAQEMWKQFKLLQALGKGGMGHVFLAEDTALDRKVALKFLPTALEADGVARERFLREAKAAAALDHPYICKIYEIGEVDGKAYIAMEYIEGTTLFEKVASGPLPLPRVLELGAEIAEALEAAHKKQIVHRDIKSANIMVTPDGHVKILDFGLARMLAMEALSASKIDTYSGRLSSHDSTPGTVIYMSPEQVRGEPIDGRTDIFSLGVVLYEMATAKLPFQGATSGLIYDAILNLGPRPPTYHNPQVPPELERIILKALEKDREHRYQNARDLVVDLKRLKRDADAPLGRSTGTPREWKRKAALPAAAVLLVTLGAALFRFLPSAPPSGPIDSLAVLPFENTRSDPEIDYLSEGIAETLINRLSPIPEIRVMARSTAFRYRGLTPLEAGRELKVGAVVTGRLVQQGDNLNVQAELVDVANGTQIWGEQYNRKLADIVTVQNNRAEHLAGAPTHPHWRRGHLRQRGLSSVLEGSFPLEPSNERGSQKSDPVLRRVARSGSRSRSRSRGSRRQLCASWSPVLRGRRGLPPGGRHGEGANRGAGSARARPGPRRGLYHPRVHFVSPRLELGGRGEGFPRGHRVEAPLRGGPPVVFGAPDGRGTPR
jgi:serine/threonine protein kinase